MLKGKESNQSLQHGPHMHAEPPCLRGSTCSNRIKLEMGGIGINLFSFIYSFFCFFSFPDFRMACWVAVPDVLNVALLFLAVSEILRLGTVSKAWHAASIEDGLWALLSRRDFRVEFCQKVTVEGPQPLPSFKATWLWWQAVAQAFGCKRIYSPHTGRVWDLWCKIEQSVSCVPDPVEGEVLVRGLFDRAFAVDCRDILPLGVLCIDLYQSRKSSSTPPICLQLFYFGLLHKLEAFWSETVVKPASAEAATEDVRTKSLATIRVLAYAFRQTAIAEVIMHSIAADLFGLLERSNHPMEQSHSWRLELLLVLFALVGKEIGRIRAGLYVDRYFQRLRCQGQEHPDRRWCGLIADFIAMRNAGWDVGVLSPQSKDTLLPGMPVLYA